MVLVPQEFGFGARLDRQEATMTHLLATLSFFMLMFAIGALIVRLIRDDAERIASVLLRLPVAEVKPWPSRVRMVSMRPSARLTVARREVA